MKTVSEQLREAVRDSGRTLSDLAHEAGINKSILTRFMQGEGLRSFTMDPLCRVLGLEITDKKPNAGKPRKGR